MKKRLGRPKGPGIELPKESIIRAYNQGMPVWELAREYRVAYGTMWNRLHRWGVKVRRACPIPKKDRHLYAGLAETGNRGETNPGKDSAESNSGVSESPPARHLAEESIDFRRQQILELEEAVADKQVEVGKREAELKKTQEEEPKEASEVVTKLKQADVELRDFEAKLATLKGVA